MRPWYERYFTADYWAYATAEYDAERTAAEVAYLAGVLAAAPGRRVLDVGCGIGRHAIGLARLGFQVTGVDVSPWALRRAADDAAEAGVSAASAASAAGGAGGAVSWHRLDALTAADGDWPVSEVDAVVCVQAFGWGTDGQQRRLLRSLRGLLAPGGVLVLDHSNVSAILRMYASRSVATIGDHTFEFLRSYDPLTGRSGGVVRVCRPDGEVVELPDDVRLYQPPEVAALLAGAGFEVCRTDADFTAGAPVGMDTRYVQFVARAPGWPVSALAGHRAPVAAGELDLRWAPDEVDYAAEALAAAWREVGGPDVLDRVRRYDLADPYGAHRCTAAVSAHLAADLQPAQVTAGAGATGLLRALAGLATADTVLMDPGGHPELGLAAAELGAAVRPVPLDRPADAVPAVHAARPAVTVLDRPGVAGAVWPLDAVHALAEACAQAGGVLVVDETCATYLPPGDSAAALTARGTPALVVVRSMSKGYCCGGLRVGFAVASPDVASRVRAVCPPLAAGALALDVALALLARGDVLAPLRARVAQVKPRFVELLAAAGLTVRAGDPRLPWVTLPAGSAERVARLGIAGKHVPGPPELLRLSVPLSEARWLAARAALGERPVLDGPPVDGGS